MGRFCAIFLVAGLQAAAVGFVSAAETRTRLGLELAAGVDSNPLWLNASESGGQFTELRLDGGFQIRTGPVLGLFLDARGRSRAHDTEVDGADLYQGHLRGGFEITANPASRRRLTIGVGGVYGAWRGTFNDRSDGSVYEVPADPAPSPGATVTIPDRYDHDVTGVFVDLNLRVSRRVTLFLDSLYEQARYTVDYSDVTDLDALDHRSLTLRPGATWRVSRIVSLTLAAVIADLEYDRLPALDEAGIEVPDTARHYDYRDFRATVTLAPRRDLGFNLGVRGGGRDDVQAGFYDYANRSSFVNMTYRPSRRTALLVQGSWYSLDYDHALVPDLVRPELRANDVRRFSGRFDWQALPWLDLFVEGGALTATSTDPFYAYEQDWLVTGIQFRRSDAFGSK